MIDPNVASGTRDILPTLAIQRDRVVRAFKATFEQFGFVPIDTPVLERREVLYAKGGQEVQRQVFEVSRRGQDQQENELALRFDLTVPLARFMAKNVDKIGVPFKRYHIGLVYRGERAQRGRFREFYQCDFDTVGVRTAISDAEIGQVIVEGLRSIDVHDFTLKLNNRMILNGMLDSLGVRDQSAHVLRSLDKLDKIGPKGVLAELQFADRERTERVLEEAVAQKILEFIESSAADAPGEALASLDARLGSHEEARLGIDNLRSVVELLVHGGADESHLKVDVGLARGLDYYTGIVFETMVDGQENYGSVCSGGRYDDLAGLFTSRQLPGVGASFGLDRLVQLLADTGKLDERSTVASVLVIHFQEDDVKHYVRIAQELRQAGIAAELYPRPNAMGKQFGYASNRGHRLSVVAGPDELAAGCVSIRDMINRAQIKDVPRSDMVAQVSRLLDASGDDK